MQRKRPDQKLDGEYLFAASRRTILSSLDVGVTVTLELG